MSGASSESRPCSTTSESNRYNGNNINNITIIIIIVILIVIATIIIYTQRTYTYYISRIFSNSIFIYFYSFLSFSLFLHPLIFLPSFSFLFFLFLSLFFFLPLPRLFSLFSFFLAHISGDREISSRGDDDRFVRTDYIDPTELMFDVEKRLRRLDVLRAKERELLLLENHYMEEQIYFQRLENNLENIQMQKYAALCEYKMAEMKAMLLEQNISNHIRLITLFFFFFCCQLYLYSHTCIHNTNNELTSVKDVYNMDILNERIFAAIVQRRPRPFYVLIRRKVTRIFPARFHIIKIELF